MDGVLCHSEEISRQAACEVMRELYGLEVQPEEFLPFTGTGEANFLGGVARKYGAPFKVESCKKRFFEIYLSKYCVPGCGIEHKGARELVEACRAAGLKTAVASSADRVKVDAQLSAANIPHELFDAIVSADVFERLKPAPDIFLSAAEQLGVHPSNCVVIEDAVAGVQAARAAGMRVIGVTTSLAPAVMEVAAPDLIYGGPQDISIADILGLKLRQQAQQQAQQAQQQGGATPPSSSSSRLPAERPTAAAAPSSSSASSSSSSASWLDGWVDLPAGYRTTRRDALKFLSLGGAFGSLWVGITRAQSLSYVSPQAILNALLPQAQLPAAAAETGGDGGRVAAFKRYIADLEKRGGGTAVPEFPAGADWLNAPPLRMSRELRGKVTVLDFWTYCCINCMHILPDLAYVEKKYDGTPFAVVGVHSAKFEAEKDSEAIRSAVLRYEIEHPVVNDGGMTMWRALGVNSWPTLAVVSPNGRLIAMVAGEGHRQDIDDIVAAALEYYGEKGQLDDTPLPVALERERDPRLAASPLRFPGKLATDLAGNRLFISDSSNNRIVITDLKGNFIEQIGCGAAGLVDGSYEDAAFHRPQGVAYSPKRNCLYVADTEAHALREIDLRKKSVKTLAGSGVKGSDYSGGQKGAAQLLNSPWDLALDSNEQYLYIAMAGQHQIWRMDTATGVLANFSGSGYERNQNGTSALTTAWAQPSGLALAPSGDAIYVADSESSSVRRLDLGSGGSRLLVGGDPMFSDNLFRFGDKDGSGSDALLQHPLAVLTAPDGKVYVADSYNHRLKVLDPETATITAVAGSGSAGYKDGVGTAAQLSEPGGLAAGPDGTVILADTNNGLIRQFDPRTQRITTLALAKVPPPRRSPDGPPAGAAAAAEPPPGAALVRAPEAVAAGSGELQLAIRLPKGYHLTPGANSRFEAALVGGSGGSGSVQLQPAAGNLAEDGSGTTATATVKFSRQGGSGTGGSTDGSTALIRVLAKVYFCQDRDVCLFQEICFDVPLAPAVQQGQPAAAVPLQFALSASAPVVQLPGL
ncbi:hypothetical protein COHA_007984 [Chlorella ohadii]|uniref:Thioredoxin domain-containing protein n=1 Tax=Chlorella ohadii TaxID=2649997 RepID=A0AAD5DKT8_9CHLO|nr:hypothetical protein COHA_007984 [Chlorella ohadii]